MRSQVSYKLGTKCSVKIGNANYKFFGHLQFFNHRITKNFTYSSFISLQFRLEYLQSYQKIFLSAGHKRLLKA